MASENLEEGLRLFVKNGKMLSTTINIELTESEDQLLIKYKTPLIIDPQIKVHPCAIQLGIALFPKMFSLVASKNISASKVYFNFSIKGALKTYEDYFQCPIEESSAFVGISFSKNLLKEALPTHDPELVALNAMAVNKYISEMNNGEISNKVIKIITELLPSGCPNEESIAFKLHMSKRTLQRKLSSEGQPYSALLNSVRLMLAKRHLTMADTSITELAYQLGYSSPSAFARAFKKQTSLSPAEYRAQN
jgi:AraC-like DNA-binding protein